MFSPLTHLTSPFYSCKEKVNMKPMNFTLRKLGPQVFRAGEMGAYENGGAVLPTGIGPLDDLLKEGLPRGGLVEIVGVVSSGRTGLFLSILAEATNRGEQAVYIDAFDSLDPLFAKSCGVDMNRLLWVRCRSDSSREAVSKAMKATDIVIRSGGFGVVALDIEPVCSTRDRCASQPSLRSWFRLQRALRGTTTTCLTLHSFPLAGSAASLVLSHDRTASKWGNGSSGQKPEVGSSECPRMLCGIETEVEMVRGSRHGSVAFCSGF